MTLDETIGAKAGDTNAATDDITATNTDPFAGAYLTPIGALTAVDLVDTTVATGADGTGATTAVALSIVGGSGSGSPMPSVPAGNYRWAGTLDGNFDNNPSTADLSVNFTLTAFPDGHYELDLAAPVTSTTCSIRPTVRWARAGRTRCRR